MQSRVDEWLSEQKVCTGWQQSLADLYRTICAKVDDLVPGANNNQIIWIDLDLLLYPLLCKPG